MDGSTNKMDAYLCNLISIDLRDPVGNCMQVIEADKARMDGWIWQH